MDHGSRCKTMLLGVVLGMSLATAASAAMLEVDYTYDGTSDLSAGFTATIKNGNATFRFTSDGNGNITDGAATLLFMSQMATASFQNGLGASFFIDAVQSLTASIAGTLSNGILVLTGGNLAQSGYLVCSGSASACGAANPAIQPGANPLPSSQPLDRKHAPGCSRR